MKKTPLNIIITGGPGTGKTSVVRELKRRGYLCFEEKAREVIKEELLAGTNHVPWQDLASFSEKVFHKIVCDLKRSRLNEPNFFDRGIPDILAYLKNANLPIADFYYDEIKKGHYHQEVFITPPWPGIYATDNERRESFEGCIALHHSLIDVYRELGFTVVELPLVSIDKRIEIIEGYLNKISQKFYV
ncbi:MAG: AAA family ATPase [Flavobacteriales bacterium]